MAGVALGAREERRGRLGARRGRRSDRGRHAAAAEEWVQASFSLLDLEVGVAVAVLLLLPVVLFLDKLAVILQPCLHA